MVKTKYFIMMCIILCVVFALLFRDPIYIAVYVAASIWAIFAYDRMYKREEKVTDLDLIINRQVNDAMKNRDRKP